MCACLYLHIWHCLLFNCLPIPLEGREGRIGEEVTDVEVDMGDEEVGEVSDVDSPTPALLTPPKLHRVVNLVAIFLATTQQLFTFVENVYVFDLCCGHNPCSVVYDPANIRDHLAMCLKDCRVRQFPVLCDREYAPSGKIVTSVELHCSCRMPEFDGDRMVCCDLCGTWYHKHCMDIPEEVFDDENIEWLCKNCMD